ncbi:MAG: VTT domain-containing protein [bacterium]
MAYLLMFAIGFLGASLFIAQVEVYLLAFTNLDLIIEKLNRGSELKLLSWTIDLGDYSVEYEFLLVLTATLGSLAGSSVYYFAGAKSVGAAGRFKRWVERMDLERFRRSGAGVTLMSAACGIPPFTPTSFAAGMIGVPFGRYVLASLAGKCARYSAVVYSAEWMKEFLIKAFF